MSLDAELVRVRGILNSLYNEKDDIEAELWRVEQEISDYEDQVYDLEDEKAELSKSAA